MTITPTAQQAQALGKITSWFADPNRQVFRLFGYAGTGKTSLAQHLVNELGVTNVCYGAFTGKAAFVMAQKGCVGASTLHRLIYIPQEKAQAKLRALLTELDTETDPDKQAILDKQIKIEKQRLETPDWILREPDETELSTTDLLVVDEVSMVATAMAADLLSFGTKVLVLGDPAQLPPVDGGGYFIHAQPDHLLTEIHRSALDSPVTRLATAVRGSATGDRSYGIAGLDGDSGRTDRITIAELLQFDQVLVGTNKSRWQTIHLLRALRGRVGEEPTPGDRIIILSNSGDAEVFNGQQFNVLGCVPHTRRDDQLNLHVADDEGATRHLTAWRAGFTNLEGERQAKRDGRGSVVAATFGQAITVHKAQGSQWDRVLVVDESAVFAGMEAREKARARAGAGLPDNGEAAAVGHVAGRRWLYTAVTRAAQQVVIAPGIRGLLR
jgi:exodeoxyribonuclease-5